MKKTFCGNCFFWKTHKPLRAVKCFHPSCFEKQINYDNYIYKRISDDYKKNKNNSCSDFAHWWKIFTKGSVSIYETFSETEINRSKPSPMPPRRKEIKLTTEQ